MSPISQIGQSNSHFATHRVTPAARVRSYAESAQTSLTLSVRTAEGDTVVLSFDTTSLKELESAKVRSSEGNVTYSRASRTDTFNFSAVVAGDLSDQELADIGGLIQSLQSGEVPTDLPSSINAYAGSFEQTTSVVDSTTRLYA